MVRQNLAVFMNIMIVRLRENRRLVLIMNSWRTLNWGVKNILTSPMLEKTSVSAHRVKTAMCVVAR